MKLRTVRRGIVVLCLLCILAACARESAPAVEPPANAAASAPPSASLPEMHFTPFFLHFTHGCAQE